MELRQKLISLGPSNSVAELNKILNYSRVTISWWGERLVSVDGYQGAVEINELALTFLKSEPFEKESNATLKDRLACFIVWGRVQQLYKESWAALASTCMYKFLVPMKEFRPYCRACAGDPMAIIGEWDFGAGKNRLFECTPTEFQKIWPDAKPLGESFVLGSHAFSKKWIASREMVESVLRA